MGGRGVLLAVVVVAVLVGVPGVGHRFAAQDSPTGTGAPAALVTDAIPLPNGASAAPLAPTTPVGLTFVLRGADPAGLRAFVERTAAPEFDRSQYLTESEFEAQFAPTPAAVGAVSSFLRASGAVAVTSTPDRLGVSAVLPAATIDRTFAVTLVTYGTVADRPLYTVQGTPQLPSALRPWVTGVGGLSDWANPWLSIAGRPVASGTVGPAPPAFVLDNATHTPLYIGSDFTQVLGVSDLLPGPHSVTNATYPTQEAVATILMSGFNSTTQTDTPGFDPVAVRAYFNDTFPTAWPQPRVVGVPVTVDGRTPPPPGGSGAIEDSSLDATENALDIEMAGSLAPGATVADFYFPASLYLATSAAPPVGSVADFFATTLAAALSYDYAPAHLAAVSNSFGLPDLNDSLWNAELLHAAAIGVTVVASSGDQGDAPNSLSGRFQGPWPTWPGTAAFDDAATVAVGGVTAQLGGNPAGVVNGTGVNVTYDPAVSGVASASAWYDTSGGPGTYSGSEGGISPVIAEPYWQFHSAAQPAIANASAEQGVSVLGRAEPDVAFVANTTIAYVAHDAAGVYYQVLEGTSIAAPTFAGLLASSAAVAGHAFGSVDPELYRIASYYAAHPGASDPFVDVVSGTNYVFAAAPGWDPVTGWGLLTAPAFVVADATPAVADYLYTGPTPGIPTLPPAAAPSTALPLTIVVFGLVVAGAVVAVLVWGRPRTSRHLPPPYAGPPPPPVPPAAGPPPPALTWRETVVPAPYPPVGVPPPPPGSYAPPPPVPPPPMFRCPFCGALRPAEPVRCPGCGAY